jgi:hypothetical protein
MQQLAEQQASGPRADDDDLGSAQKSYCAFMNHSRGLAYATSAYPLPVLSDELPAIW